MGEYTAAGHPMFIEMLQNAGWLARGVPLTIDLVIGALAKAQEFHGLPISRQFDAASIAALKGQRCMTADRPDASVTPPPYPARWPGHQLRWTVFDAGTLPPTAVREVFDTAFTEWGAVCGMSPIHVEDRLTAQVGVEFVTMDGPRGSVGWTESLDPEGKLQRRILLNRELPWFIGAPDGTVPAGMLDLRRVALHETGHALGVGHLAEPSVMAPCYPLAPKRLSRFDVEAAVELYGPPLPEEIAVVEAMDYEASPDIVILGTDTSFPEHADAGTVECLCSRCAEPIGVDDGATFVTDLDSGVEYRYHGACARGA
jgi:hypothetical protein